MRRIENHHDIRIRNSSFLDNIEVPDHSVYYVRIKSFIEKINPLTVSQLLNNEITHSEIDLLRHYDFKFLDDETKDLCWDYDDLFKKMSFIFQKRIIYKWVVNMDRPEYKFLRRQLMDIRTTRHPLYAAYNPVTLQNLKITLMYVIKNVNGLGVNANLNWVDISQLKSLNGLFSNYEPLTNIYGDFVFQGDISLWDVHNIMDMRDMFAYSSFNGDISDWYINPDCKTDGMFEHSSFDGPYPHGYRY